MPALVLALFIVILGIQPNWMVRWSEPQAAILLTGTEDAIRLAPPSEIVSQIIDETEFMP
jgi:NAD(P)H-quinone oxidoreductase subunit 4